MSTTAPRTQTAPSGDDRVAAYLRGAVVLAFALGVAGVALPGGAGHLAAWAMVVTLVAVPFARVAWLATRWAHAPDWQFFAAAVGLLVLTAVGAVVAALT
jgi:hypothetical protein